MSVFYLHYFHHLLHYHRMLATSMSSSRLQIMTYSVLWTQVLETLTRLLRPVQLQAQGESQLGLDVDQSHQTVLGDGMDVSQDCFGCGPDLRTSTWLIIDTERKCCSLKLVVTFEKEEYFKL